MNQPDDSTNGPGLTSAEATELVPGDVVLLEAGSKVPADVRLISHGGEVDESLLTGESLTVTRALDRRASDGGQEGHLVTGDHPITALAIARELGFADRSEQVVTGPMLEELVAQGEQAVDALIGDARVFARVEPGNSRSETASLFTMSPLRNRLLFVGTAAAQLIHIAAIYTPGLRDVLHLEHVTVTQWSASLALALSLFLVSEAHKALSRRRMRTEATS